MPNREDVLQYTNQGTDTVAQRVYYTLTLDHKGISLGTEDTVRRSSALLASLIDQLSEKDILAECDIDDLLRKFGQEEMHKAGG